jgi:alpha-glucosidase
MIRTSLCSLLLLAPIAGCAPEEAAASQEEAAPPASPASIEAAEAASPDGRIVFRIDAEGGAPGYQIAFDGETVISRSRLGFRFAEAPALESGLRITGVSEASVDQSWEQPWGERREVRDHHNEILVALSGAGGPAYDLRVRVFDDGVAFRYEVAGGAGETRAVVGELTRFSLPESSTAWWIPAQGWNRYEYLYETSEGLGELDRVHTPFTVRLPEGGPHVAIHEAALTDYSGMYLDQRRGGVFEAALAPGADGVKVHVEGGFTTPWRTIQIADQAVGLANSDMILNLNEPNVLGDVSWVEPGKYVGIWWCMHINACTWGSGGRHGATTERAREYIDFAAENGFAGVLIEGWNTGWDGDWFSNGAVFSFTEAYPDFDIEAVAAYALERGVRLVGHHETSGNLANYEAQMEDAFDLYESLGVTQVKTGYVADGGDLVRHDENGERRYEWHYGQYTVNHHIRVLEAAAERGISINAHEPVKDTGLRRTYPNWISCEGARGQEFNAWGNPPNPPEHVPLLAFTRMLSGPMDFTPGIFDLRPNGEDHPSRIETTLAKQLALYVVLYSPIQMAADLPENYAAYPDVFQFIRDVPTDWEESVALQGEVGDFIVFARQERGGEDWYLGAASDEEARELTIPLDFLDPALSYEAQIYRDGAEADWEGNPYEMVIESRGVSAADRLVLPLAPGGGAAVRFTPREAN